MNKKPRRSSADAAYLRVSGVDQNCAMQRPDLERWAQAQGVNLTWYEDTFTGRSLDRPGFARLWEDVQAGKVRTVVVWRLDRLGRSVADLSRLFAQLLALNVRLVSIREGVDLSTSTGRFVANLLASVAEYEWEVIRERIMEGQRVARAAGKTWGGSRPGRRIKVSEEKEKAVLELLERRWKIARIARQVGLSRKTVYQVIERNQPSGEGP